MNGLELLSPAGSYESVLAAINAGADAVYLGAERFSARAYAENLSTDVLVKTIRKCHIHNVKVYLALNTLIRPDEFDEIVPLVKPLYEYGLDGIIVQDFGVAECIRDNFCNLSLHASTQMSIMNVHGARLLSKQGFERVVPARELTLNEVDLIKKQSGLELECFIHGAMCYSYSGLCLMSSMIGGRSGNRGKCAGTCRLPFTYSGTHTSNNSDIYPLSMKDMCTIEYLPKLIDAGIDSFKIEGRMKSPAYVAGVTALYRKYIDIYTGTDQRYEVSASDINTLKNLYIRSDICEGYYEGTKDKTLITFDKPGYIGSDNNLIEKINAEYVHEPLNMPIDIYAWFEKDEKALMTACYKDISVSVEGDVVQKAEKAPLQEKRVIEQLSKLGDTGFVVDTISVSLGEEVFLPMGALNDLRRQCIMLLENSIIDSNGLVSSRTIIEGLNIQSADNISSEYNRIEKNKRFYDAKVYTKAQLEACLDEKVDRIYLEHSLFMSMDVLDICSIRDTISEIFISLPAIFRSVHNNYYSRLTDKIKECISDDKRFIDGILVHSLDELDYISDIFSEISIISDTSVYVLNKSSVKFLDQLNKLKEFTYSYEMTIHDLYEVSSHVPSTRLKSNLVVYGNVPMMVTAGCVKKNFDMCNHIPELNKANYLQDRKNSRFPVYNDCSICSNIIFNSKPLSYHKILSKINRIPVDRYRLDFTTEDKDATKKIINGIKNGTNIDLADYTTGHIKNRETL